MPHGAPLHAPHVFSIKSSLGMALSADMPLAAALPLLPWGPRPPAPDSMSACADVLHRGGLRTFADLAARSETALEALLRGRRNVPKPVKRALLRAMRMYRGAAAAPPSEPPPPGAQPRSLESLVPVDAVSPCPGGGVVLFLAGSFCPVHNGHLHMLRAARDRVAAAGRRVIGAYLVPSSDRALGRKFGGRGPPFVPLAHRCAMLRLAAAAAGPWVQVAPLFASGAPSWREVASLPRAAMTPVPPGRSLRNQNFFFC